MAITPFGTYVDVNRDNVSDGACLSGSFFFKKANKFIQDSWKASQGVSPSFLVYFTKKLNHVEVLLNSMERNVVFSKKDIKLCTET